MAGLTSSMLCLHAFPCEQVPRWKPATAPSIPTGLCHDEREKITALLTPPQWGEKNVNNL